MITKTLTLTCLSLMLGQLPEDITPQNQRSFKLPISIDPVKQKEIRQVILYASTDQGKSWRQESVVSPDKKGFIFRAQADGLYWFRIAIVNNQGKQEPENIMRGPPDLKVLVDTEQPIVRLTSAERQGNEVLVRWEIQETYPDTRTMKLKYRPAKGINPWVEVPVRPMPRGEATVRVNDPSPLVFRLELQDLARNLSFVEKMVSGSFENKTVAQKEPNIIPVDTRQNRNPVISKNPDLGKNQIDFQENLQLPEAQEGFPNEPELAPPPKKVTSWESDGKGPQSVKSIQTNITQEPVASTNSTVRKPSFPKQAVAFPKRKPLPPVQIVNKTVMTLEYGLNKVGPSGIGKIELWMTRDDGQTWQLWAEDPEVNPAMRDGKYKRMVELPGEGVYGLSLVAKNRAGLGKPAPQSGEVPQMRIEVDLTAPEAVLYRPVPDSQKKNSLLITWEAKDRNLATNPIALEWAEHQNGPWQSIQTSLPNHGRYSWELPPGLPVYVHLRIRAIDSAGNEAIAVTNEPQLADLSEPEVNLLSVIVTPKH